MAARDGSTIEQSIEIDLSSSEDEGEPPAPPQPPSPAEQPQQDEPEHCHFAVRLKLQGLGATARTKSNAKPRRRRGRPLTLRYETTQRKRRKVAEAAEATVLAVEEGADDAAERMVTVTMDAAAVFSPAAPNRTLALELSPAQANRASSSEPSTMRMVKAVQLPSRDASGEEVEVMTPVAVNAAPALPLLDVAPQAPLRRHKPRRASH